MADQTSDPVQDAGLASPPIQGIDEGVVKSGGNDTAHVPITTPPEEKPQSQAAPVPPAGQQPTPLPPPSNVDPSAGGIITSPLTPRTGQQADTPTN